MEKASTATSYVSSVGLTIYGFTVQNWIGFAGLFIAFLTFSVNTYIKYQHLKLARDKQREHSDANSRHNAIEKPSD